MPREDRSGVRGRLGGSGVYYGWFVVAGCFLLSLMTAGTIFSFSVFLGPILETFGQSTANTSLIFGVQSVVTFGGAAVLGFAVDRYGVHRPLLVAAGLIGLGLLGASQLPIFLGVVFSYGVIAAAGIGIVFVVAYTTPPRWFDRRRGLATGIAVSGWGVGILAVPPFAEFLIGIVGWQGAYLALAVMFVLAIGVAVSIIATHPAELDVDVSREFAGGTTANGVGGAEVPPVRAQVGEAVGTVRTPLFGIVFVGFLLMFVPANAVLVYLVEFAESVGAGRRVGVIALSTIGALNVVAKFVVGAVGDRAGIDRTIAACVGLTCVTLALLVLVPTPIGILVLAAVFGFGYGGIATLMSPLVADLFGTADLSTLFGISSVGFAVAGLAVPYFIGLGFDRSGTYTIPFLAAVGFGLVSVAAFLAVSVSRSP